jgi:DNA-binding FrmR family transcriptional regulator
MSYSEDVLQGLRAVTEAATGLKDNSVDDLVKNLVLNMQSAKLQQDAALANIKLGIAGKMVEQGFTGYEAAVTSIPTSKLNSQKLSQFQEEGLPGFGYRFGRRKINNDIEAFVDTFEKNYATQRNYYNKLVTTSKLTGGTSNPIVRESVAALKQQQANLLDAINLYESTVFESRGEGGIFTRKGRSQDLLARLQNAEGLVNNLIENIED